MRSRVRRVAFHASIHELDVTAVHLFLEAKENTEFVRDRRKRNVSQPPPEFSKDQFWYVLMGCLLTTQQRSTKGSPVDLFLSSKPFPLGIRVCDSQTSLKEFILMTLQNFGRIRRGITIASQGAENLHRLNKSLWTEAEDWFVRLKKQRSREPQPGDQALERDAARWADEALAGLGPKQSRNFWQWLGLTRYEIPLDSRVTEWINKNLSAKVEAKRLGNIAYYESVLDWLQGICKKAGVLPCQLDAAAFDYENVGVGKGPVRVSTEPGFVNANRQVVIRNTGLQGTDPQSVCVPNCVLELWTQLRRERQRHSRAAVSSLPGRSARSSAVATASLRFHRPHRTKGVRKMPSYVQCDKGHSGGRCREAAIEISENGSLGACAKANCKSAVRYIVSHHYANQDEEYEYEVVNVVRLRTPEEVGEEGYDPMIFLLREHKTGKEMIWPFYWGIDKKKHWRVGQFPPIIALSELKKAITALEK
jgi:hypothetical protein